MLSNAAEIFGYRSEEGGVPRGSGRLLDVRKWIPSFSGKHFSIDYNLSYVGC